jgi:hypothetical protein
MNKIRVIRGEDSLNFRHEVFNPRQSAESAGKNKEPFELNH